VSGVHTDAGSCPLCPPRTAIQGSAVEPAHPWRSVNRVVIVERYLGGATARRLAAPATETDAALVALGLPARR
jgi:hypothetical protein